MSDERLRELERRWRESGAVADEAAWLAERVRVGEPSRERVELAAYLEHPAARVIEGDALTAVAVAELQAEVVSLRPRVPPDDPGSFAEPFKEWAVSLLAWGPEACVRALLGPMHEYVPAWESAPILHDLVSPRRAMEALENWCLCPCPAHAEVLRALDSGLEEAFDEAVEYRGGLPGTGVALVGYHACRIVFGEARSRPHLMRQASEWAYGEFEIKACGQRFPPRAPDWSPLRTLVTAELLPWALGRHDPLRERRNKGRPGSITPQA